MRATVTLEPWADGDLPLLERLMGDPRMTEHLGGPETPEKLRERQGRYERLEGGDRMFKIVELPSGAGVGSVGFWTKHWRDQEVYEIGWMVVPEFQGRGIAVAATTQAVGLARRGGQHRFMHAFPNVENAASNAICRKLGFELLAAHEFEFPKGHWMTCNDWRLDLRDPDTREEPSAMPADERYNIHLDDKFGHLTLVDVAAEAALHQPWFNQTLTSVNDAVVRLGVIEGDFHWHHHDDTDEFFLVLEGQLLIDLKDRETVTLHPHQGFTVPRGVEHRTRAPERTSILMIEAAGVVPTGD